ncbi:hypothetical protein [Streptomyces sp. LN500]|uniref:hypothetical protein n=1 Tax=Streptomyces sp. LN500 TaxID=3112978 RepID=UPI00371EC10A
MPKVPIPRSGPITLVVVAALALGVMPATAAISAAPAGPVQPTAAQQAPGGISTHTVTLVTGDKVTIGTAADGTAVRSFEGVNGTTTGFHRAVIDGSTYVYPDAVLPYVTTGKLDKQLFNVTRLIADGYDDAHTSRLPLIVRYTAAAARSRTQPKVAWARPSSAGWTASRARPSRRTASRLRRSGPRSPADQARPPGRRTPPSRAVSPRSGSTAR